MTRRSSDFHDDDADRDGDDDLRVRANSFKTFAYPPDAEVVRARGTIAQVVRGLGKEPALAFDVNDTEWKLLGARQGDRLEVSTLHTKIAAKLKRKRGELALVLSRDVPAGAEVVRVRLLDAEEAKQQAASERVRRFVEAHGEQP